MHFQYKRFFINCQEQEDSWMYICKNCGLEFETPLKATETHLFSDTPFEVLYLCPACKSNHFHEKDMTHCRCCGAKLSSGAEEYCSEACRRKGNKLWDKQKKRLKREENDPLFLLVKEAALYNRKNGTDYSYGQYVSLVKPTLKKENGKCAVKRKKP